MTYVSDYKNTTFDAANTPYHCKYVPFVTTSTFDHYISYTQIWSFDLIMRPTCSTSMRSIIYHQDPFLHNHIGKFTRWVGLLLLTTLSFMCSSSSIDQLDDESEQDQDFLKQNKIGCTRGEDSSFEHMEGYVCA